MSLILKDKKQNIFTIEFEQKELTSIKEIKELMERKYGYNSQIMRLYPTSFNKDQEFKEEDFIITAHYPKGILVDNLKFPNIQIYYDKEVSKETMDKLFQSNEDDIRIKNSHENVMNINVPSDMFSLDEPEIQQDLMRNNDTNTDDSVNFLVSMGYEKSIAIQALAKSFNNVSIAIDLINDGLIKN